MKNKLIIPLIVLMVLALVGLIAIQAMWVHNASERAKEVLAYQINEALSDATKAINREEQMVFINETFGSIDSLLRTVGIGNATAAYRESSSTQVFVIESDEGNAAVNIQRGLQSTQPFETLDSTLLKAIMRALDQPDGEVTERASQNAAEMSSMVKHYAMEQALSGSIEARITMEELDAKLGEALRAKGIDAPYVFGVFNPMRQTYEPALTSDAYDPSDHWQAIALFPNDLIAPGKYRLHVQLKNEGKLLREGLRGMVLLSVLFTLLITLSFGFALHFIFKQKKMSRVKSDFINNMTHEFKTPLASMALATASLRHPEVIRHPEEVKRMLGIIDQERTRMDKHIEKVLDMAAAESGAFKVHKSLLPLREMVQEASANIQAALDACGGQLKLDLPELSLPADRFHLVNAFTNILDNSIKYCDGPPEIAVAASVKSGWVLLTFADKGIGMSPSHAAQAFDKFFRAESGNLHQRKGFGLGLSYVKEVVSAHGGEVSLRSRLNEGTTVQVKLPMS